jgi:phage baseplate assembly protein W
MPRVTKKYSDIDLSFLPHPITGDVTVLRDEDAVKRALRNLLLMGRFDRPFEPDLGANLKQLLFEPITPLTEKALDIQIRGAISRYEPRVTILNLKVEGLPDENGYNVSLTFAIDTISTVETIDTFLERVR